MSVGQVTRRTGTVEIHADDSGLFVLEVRRPVFKKWTVDGAPEIDRLLPTEVIALVDAPGEVKVSGTAATRAGLSKNMKCPSGVKLGTLVLWPPTPPPTLPMLLMTGTGLNASRLIGVCQGASRLARFDTQISLTLPRFAPLTPPGGSEVKYRLRPSFEIAA